MRFTDDEPPRSVLRDHVLVQNHPLTDLPEPVASFLPSPHDLLLAVDRDLREFVVVSGRYRFVVRRPADDWHGDVDLYAMEIGDSRRALEAQFGPAGPTLADAVEPQHRLLERLHQDGWIDYGRTTR